MPADDAEKEAEAIDRRAHGDVSVRAVRLRKRLYDLGWSLYAAGTLSIGAAMVVGAGLGLPGPWPTWIAVPVAALSLAFYGWPISMLAGLVAGRKKTYANATIERRIDGALEVRNAAGAIEIPKDAAKQGTIVDGRHVVVEDAAGREITISTAAGDAHRILDALDLEPSARRFTFRWRRVSPRVWSYIGTLFLASFVGAAPMMLFGRGDATPIAALGCMIMSSPWLVAELVSRWYANRELTIGLDGVVGKSRLGSQSFRFADVERVEAPPGELVLVMKDGRRERLLRDAEEPGMAAAIADRVREAFALAKKSSGAGSAAAALLERAGRTLPEWREAAARVLTAATGFRDAAITPDEIGAVIDDATAPADQRLAAAIALGSRADAASRAKIRVAADACASPKLRVALEGLADGEASDATLEAAMAEESGVSAAAARAASS